MMDIPGFYRRKQRAGFHASGYNDAIKLDAAERKNNMDKVAEPQFLTAWEREDHEREKLVKQPLGPLVSRVNETRLRGITPELEAALKHLERRSRAYWEHRAEIHGSEMPDSYGEELQERYDDAVRRVLAEVALAD